MSKPQIKIYAEVTDLRPKKVNTTDSTGRAVKVIDPTGAMNLCITFHGGNLDWFPITKEQAESIDEGEFYTFTFDPKVTVFKDGDFSKMGFVPSKLTNIEAS